MSNEFNLDEGFIIGCVYHFTYEKDPTKKHPGRILVQLKDSWAKVLIEDLYESRKLIEIKQFNQNLEATDLNHAEIFLNRLKGTREEHFGKKSAPTMVELELAGKIRELASMIFASKIKNGREQNWDLFIRNYDPQYMKPSAVDDNKAIKAVFAGHHITRHGKRVFSWYVLSPLRIEEKYFNEKYMEEV